MKINFKPKNELESFGITIYNMLVENFSKTFFVGGMVRDSLLGKEITDIDIATSATPEQVSEILKNHFIEYNTGYKNLGVIVAIQNGFKIAIATFRKDLPADNRYPEIAFVKDPKTDSIRRDFTINALYFGVKSKDILDYHEGLKDLKKKKIKFIGDAEKRIQEDPLRMIRALRFALELNFKIEKKSYNAIKNNFYLTQTDLTKNKMESEIKKLSDKKNKNILEKVINKPEVLDKIFKWS